MRLTPGERQRGAGRQPVTGGGVEVRLDQVRKAFGDFVAVRDVDLRVEAGEFLTLLGPSGSGKTTILNMIAGFIKPDAGQILLGGSPIDDRPPERRGLGVVFQSYALFPHMTVADNVAFPLRMRGAKRAEAQRLVDRSLELLHLSDQASKFPSQLSGGQQQRVSVARAIVFEPAVVLMDEPLSALDRRLREVLQIELKKLHQRIGSTFIYVTHDQGEALTMSDRIGVMSEGRVIALGTPRELYDTPNHAFVASFLGESNRLDGAVAFASSGVASVSLASGLTVKGTVEGEELPVGASVCVAIRPERVQVAAAPQGRDNEFAGVVRDIVFLGETTRLEIELQAGVVIFARRPNDGQGAPPDRGSSIWACWGSADARVLAHGAQGSHGGSEPAGT